MKIGLIVIGKTDAGYFVEAINEYKNRLTHYIPFEMEVIPDIKNVKILELNKNKFNTPLFFGRTFVLLKTHLP